MFDSSSVIVGLEIGTTKVCAAVGELNADHALNIIGLGQAPSQGVRKGEIVNPSEAEECIRAAMVQAEKMANAELGSVFLGITGGHLRGLTNHGIHPVVSADREITQQDVEDVVKNAKSINLPADHSILHAIRQHFTVDGQTGCPNPVGMLGARLEVDVHVVHGKTNRVQNAVRAVRGLQLEVEAVVFNGLASSLAVLTPEQKETGALVIDLGAGTTDYVAYVDGIIKHTGVLAVGGDHVSNDLAYGLKVPLGRAESLKIEHGAARLQESARGQRVVYGRDATGAERTVSKEHLQLIMAARIEETLQLVADDLEAVGLLGYLGAGVVLCGGGARIPEIAEVAAGIFGTPVTLGRTNCINGLKSALDHPEFATAIGLVRYGSLQQTRRQSGTGLVSTVKETLSSLFNRRS
jgi:cell division protein FtsA